METFSQENPDTPLLRTVYVTYIKKCWQGSLNSTINWLYHHFPAIEAQETCQTIKKPLVQAALNIKCLATIQDEATEARETCEVIMKPSAATIQDEATKAEETCEAIMKSFAQAASNIEYPATLQDEATEAQETCEVIMKPLIRAASNVGGLATIQDEEAQETCEAIMNPLVQATLNIEHPATIQDEATEAQETCEAIMKPLVQVASNIERPVTIQDEAVEAQQTCEAIKKSLVQATSNIECPAIIQDEDNEGQEIYEAIDSLLVQAPQNSRSSVIIQDQAIEAQETCEAIMTSLVEATSSIESSIIQDEEESYDQEISSNEDSFNQASTSIAVQNREIIKARETTKTIERPLIQVAHNAESPTMIQDAEKSYDTKSLPNENLFNQTTTFIRADNKETIRVQEICEGTEESLVLASQMSPITIQDEGSHDRETSPCQNLFNQTTASERDNNRKMIDPPPPQAPAEATIPSILANNAYTSYKDMLDISAQNLPYLEAGLKRHPQVLDWLKTKRHRRTFASSFFSLFADVTRLLRTTRRGYLSEDDRNYIMECCTTLQGVGFDASWLNYAKGCIEECDDIMRKCSRGCLEETEGKASTLKNQLESIKEELASVEASLVLLHDKASGLGDFIES